MDDAHGSAEAPETAYTVDTRLHLGLAAPSASQRSTGSDAKPETKSGSTAIDLDLTLFTGPSEIAADESGSDHLKPERPMGGGGVLVQTLHAAEIGFSSSPRKSAPNQETDEETADEQGSKRVRSEQPTTGGTANAPVSMLLQHPRAFPTASYSASRSTRRKASPHPPAAAHHGDGDASSATVPTWVRAELLPRHGLPRDSLLHFVGAEVLRKSDMDPRQARFLIPSGASGRLRAFLSTEEIAACGFDSTNRRAPPRRDGKKRARPTTYVGVPVSIYERGGEWSVSELWLNKFHRSDGTVINGSGYIHFMGNCGFAVGDCVEVWAFRRPPQHLCFVIAKMDDSTQAAGV